MNKKPKRNIILTPAPATTTQSVKMAQVVSDICPREKEFGKLMQGICKDLVKIVKGNEEYTSVLFTGSGTAVMDSVINSVVPENQGILIIVNGAYGKRMIEIANIYKIPYVIAEYEWGTPIDLKEVERAIWKYKKNISCVAVVHHETTTGILNPIEEIGKIVKKYNKTYIIDTISSYAGIPIDIKKVQADFIMASANKCLQGMPGISFVIAKKSELNKLSYYPPRSFYLNLYTNYRYFQDKMQTPFTPAVQCLYALRQAINEYFKEKNRYKRYYENWLTLVIGMKKLGFNKILLSKHESHLVTTFIEPIWLDFNKFHDKLKKKGFTIYPGKLTDKKTFRLGNIGAITTKDIHAFLKAVKEIL